MGDRRIEDYALIGDGETVALVGRDGSIDWLCWPRLDSDACFAALLGTSDNGRWLIAPADEVKRTRRRYLDRTLILETEFETVTGTVALIDFMPPRETTSDVVRLVVGRRGHVAMRTEFIVRFGYGKVVPWVRKAGPGALQAVAGPDLVVLRSPVELRGEGLTTVGEFAVREGETIPFVLSSGRSHETLPRVLDPEDALRRTRAFWLDWTDRPPIGGKWSDAVVRSLITVKALIYRPSGGVAAAATTSLPESPHASLNWDYRLCWLRDATFTLLALLNSGYIDEAEAWHKWLMRSVAGDAAKVQVVYGLTGERRLTEWVADWLPGFNGARPVRIGNAAAEQLQLDIFGELVDALYQGHCGELPISATGWSMQSNLLAHLETIWQRPDRGIWEDRGKPRHHTYSKIMVWVALDRAIRSVENFELDGPVDRWRHLQARVRDEVCREGYDASIGAFVQSYGSKQLDASLLLIPLVGFLPATDPRARSTIEAIERELMHEGLLLRTGNSQACGEGAFLACNFWLADDLILLGRRNDAVALLERLLSLRNDVGLLAEEYDVRNRRFTGNFPQAFSHVALVNTIHNLTKADAPAGQRSQLRRDGMEERGRRSEGRSRPDPRTRANQPVRG